MNKLLFIQLDMTRPFLNCTYLYGANLSAISSISFSDMYFHFPPPFAFSLLTSLPTKAAIPRLHTVSIVMTKSRKHILYSQISRRKDIHAFQSKTGKHLN